jgi:cold shock CspA family protein
VSELRTGTLKFFRSDRPAGGYGFIARDGSSIDDFLHISSLRESLINPDALVDGATRLSYEVESDSRNGKLKAVNLRVL